MILFDEKKGLISNHCGLGKVDVRLSISTSLFSITTISNTGVFNHYASTAYEPSWLKLIVKFSFQKVILGGGHLGGFRRVGTPKTM